MSANPALAPGMARRWLPEAVTVVVLALLPLVAPTLNINADTLSRILIWGLFGLGFDLLFGYTGLLSFGQSAFFGTGGFVMAYLVTNNMIDSVILGLAIGTVAAAVVGVVVGLVALRRTGIYFAMITVAIAEMFFFLENSPLSAWTGGENGIPGVPHPVLNLGFASYKIESGWPMYFFMAVIFVVGLIIARRIARSPVGHILTAIRDNPQRAAAVGHAIHHYKLAAFVVAAAYGGLAGGLLGVLQAYMPPEAFTFDTSGQLVIQTVIGGAGTLFGPVIGAAVWLLVQDLLQYGLGLGAAWKLGLGIIFVALVCLLRHGVVGGAADLLRRWRGSARHVPEAAAVDPAAAAAAPTPVLAAARPVQGKMILEARSLTKRYGGIVANSDINFELAEGELRGVIGPNGAGKSTFFKMLTGEVMPTTGQIFFHGEDITHKDVTATCQIGLSKSYQINQLFTKLTVRENLIISALAECRGPFKLDLLRSLDRVPGLNADVTQTLELLNLTGRADVPVADLAYGEKRRLEIGLALATSPKVLLLDEPLAGMSPAERAETRRLLREIRKGRTVVLVEHDMDAVFDLAERITVLHEGRILAEGAPDEIQNNSFVQDAYLGGVHAA
ncbi:MAG TPA: branched-chain amino acid ABC transporter ATP-binding protein/permease [Alphaproteobacteria bacterium]|nr:branched-chain amino acid ABC transporter ATP-binding protein/permease [Alphaproteobacteria bacterium]